MSPHAELLFTLIIMVTFSVVVAVVLCSEIYHRHKPAYTPRHSAHSQSAEAQKAAASYH